MMNTTIYKTHLEESLNLYKTLTLDFPIHPFDLIDYPLVFFSSFFLLMVKERNVGPNNINTLDLKVLQNHKIFYPNAFTRGGLQSIID
jgi:hypothetical protein